MPDPIVSPPAPSSPPAGQQPPSSPLSASPPPDPLKPESPKGSQQFIDEIEGMMKPPEKPKDDKAKAQPKKEPAKAEPKDDKTVQKTDDHGSPDPDDLIKDPKDLRRRLKEIKESVNKKITESVSKVQAEKQAELDRMNQRLAEYERRKYLTPEDEERYKSLESKAAELERELNARDYSTTEDFKKKYKARWDGVWQEVFEDLKGVTVVDSEGNSRVANATDFNRVLNATRAEAKRIAKELFGEDADMMLAHRNALIQIRKDGDAEIEAQREKYESDKKAKAEQMRQENEGFVTTSKTIASEIDKKFPAWAKPENDEEAEMLKRGSSIFDESINNFSKLDVQQRASRAALIARWASSFLMLDHRLRQQGDKIKALEADLLKYQKSEPGNEGDADGGAAPAKTGGKTTEDLIKEFEQ